MTVNEYVKKWCEEDYDVRKEDFYVDNAYYVADREWAINGFKHGMFALTIAICTSLFGSPNFGEALLRAVVTLGVLTICFWFYGIRNYDANCLGTSLSIYVMLAILLFISKNKVPTTAQIFFAIGAGAFWFYLTFVKPIMFIKVARKMRKRMEEEDEEEEKNTKQSYSKWENGYKAFRYGLPEPEQKPAYADPVMVEARKLFEGYETNKQVLKTRYRQLAKQHHPDKGGDTKMFQCIIAAYEEINRTLVS